MIAVLPGAWAGAAAGSPLGAVVVSWLTVLLHDVLEVAALAVAGIVVGAVYFWWGLRAPSPGDDGGCVACGSTDLEVVAPGVYVCRACGYEGGDGRPAWERDRRQAEWASRPWPERVTAARTAVRDALRQLLALEPDVRRWPAEAVVAAYAATWEQGATDQQRTWYAAEREGVARGALVSAIVGATAPLHTAGEAVPDLGVPDPEDPSWNGEPREVFARAQAAATEALSRIDKTEASLVAGPAADADPAPDAAGGR